MNTKIRELKRKDIKRLARMVSTLGEKIGPNGLLDVFNADIQPEETALPAALEYNPKVIQLGMKVITLLLEHYDEAMGEWFADLTGNSPADIDEAPVDFDLDVACQIIESSEAERFFSKALRLRNWTAELSTKFGIRKTD